MTDEQKALVHGLLLVAWADNTVNPDEQRFFNLVVQQLGVDPGEMAGRRHQEREFDLTLALPDAGPRREVMKLLVAMAMVDGTVNAPEVRVLTHLAHHLQIGDDELERLKSDVLEEMETSL